MNVTFYISPTPFPNSAVVHHDRMTVEDKPEDLVCDKM